MSQLAAYLNEVIGSAMMLEASILVAFVLILNLRRLAVAALKRFGQK